MNIDIGCVPEWPNGADCKSAVFDFGGSNPSAPTLYAEVFCKTSESLLLQLGVAKT